MSEKQPKPWICSPDQDVVSGKMILVALEHYGLDSNKGNCQDLAKVLVALGVAASKVLGSLLIATDKGTTTQTFHKWTALVQEGYLGLDGFEPEERTHAESQEFFDSIMANFGGSK